MINILGEAKEIMYFIANFLVVKNLSACMNAQFCTAELPPSSNLNHVQLSVAMFQWQVRKATPQSHILNRHLHWGSPLLPFRWMDAARNQDIRLCELEYPFFTQILKLTNSVSSMSWSSQPSGWSEAIGCFESEYGVSNLSLCCSFIMRLFTAERNRLQWSRKRQGSLDNTGCFDYFTR